MTSKLRSNPSGHSIAVIGVLSAIVAMSPQALAAGPRNLAVPGDITEMQTLSQNWSDAEASQFYGVPQGSQLIPFDWFLHLERADSEKLFRDADHVASLGYLPRTADQPGNPHGLPVGFTKDGVHLGITCAACHTAQINYRGKAWLVDGAPTTGDFERLLRRLVDALHQTKNDEAKFARFARAVLGADANAALKAKLTEVEAFRRGYNDRNLPRGNAPPFGPGRVDAFC